MNTDKNQLVECGCGCGEIFVPFDKRGRPRKYIYGHWARTQPSKKEIKKCSNCGAEVERPQWHIKRVKNFFCSKECEGEFFSKSGIRRGKNNGHYNTITVACAGCGEPVSKAESLIKRRNNRVYCPNCVKLCRKGRKGFYVGYPKQFSSSLRTKVRKRDNHTCQLCGKHQKQTGTLHVHHIDYNKSNNHQRNLVSLCRVCHGETNYGTEKWEKQLTDFMKTNHPHLF